VHLLEAANQILIREDQDAAGRVAKALRRDGVEIVSACKIGRVFRQTREKIVELECGGEHRAVTVDEILVAVGRAPNVERIGLEAAGVDYAPRRGVRVDDHLRTTNPRIYAAGDCCFQYKFTHTADALARIVVQNALFGLPFMKKKASALTIPWCTYTDPEIAHVGMYERDAAERGIPIDTYARSFADVDRAVADGEVNGFVKVHVKKGTDRILGATIVARHAGDMISEITLAMVAEVGLGTVSGVIHPYPTQAEAIKQTGDAYNRTRLTPFVKKLFSWWLARGR
jgi:pyruvate/2-oxoglutarate dehydrogenase complex dihydrolipoamide dehydrogenase (E3) component